MVKGAWMKSCKDFRRAGFSCQLKRNVGKMMAYTAVWIQSGRALWYSSNSSCSVCLVFMASVGVAWAGERGYQLVAGGTASSAPECWKRFVRMWTIEGSYDISTKFFGRSPGSRSS